MIGNPEDGLVAELEELGSAVEVVTGVWDLSKPENTEKLVNAGLERFGRIDAATAFSRQIIGGPFLDSTLDDVHQLEGGLIEAPYHFLKGVLPTRAARGHGQVLVITSSSGARTTPAGERSGKLVIGDQAASTGQRTFGNNHNW